MCDDNRTSKNLASIPPLGGLHTIGRQSLRRNAFSTRTTIKHGENEDGQSFHLYEDWIDYVMDDHDIHLDLDGIECSITLSSSGSNLKPRVSLKIPREFAIKLGLVDSS